MSVSIDHVRKLVRMVGSDRSSFSPDEIREAEAELLLLGVAGHAGRSRFRPLSKQTVLGVCIISIVLAFALDRFGVTHVTKAVIKTPTMPTALPRLLTRGPTEALSFGDLRLPPNPSKADVVRHIRDVIKRDSAYIGCSSSDPQVNYLRALGQKYAEALLDPSVSSDMYVQWALKDCVRDEHKALVLSAFRWNYNLASVVADKGWENDARDTLVTGIAKGYSYYPVEFVDAVARLRDPSTYPHLIRYLEVGSNAAWTIKALSQISGLSLEKAVTGAWKSRKANNYEREELAKAALDYGHLDALELLFERLRSELRSGKADTQFRINSLREALVSHLDVAPDNEALVEWFGLHKGELRFDARRKVFSEPGTAEHGVTR